MHERPLSRTIPSYLKTCAAILLLGFTVDVAIRTNEDVSRYPKDAEKSVDPAAWLADSLADTLEAMRGDTPSMLIPQVTPPCSVVLPGRHSSTLIPDMHGRPGGPEELPGATTVMTCSVSK